MSKTKLIYPLHKNKKQAFCRLSKQSELFYLLQVSQLFQLALIYAKRESQNQSINKFLNKVCEDWIILLQHYQVIVSTQLTNKNFRMAQQNSQWNEQQRITTDAEHSTLSFPKIQRKPTDNYKDSVRQAQKNITSLPSLKPNQGLKQRLKQLQKHKKVPKNVQDNILNQIQEKMKHVLEKMNNGESPQKQNTKNSQIQFQDQIKLNKQKIKQAIITNQKKNNNSQPRQINRQQDKSHKRSNSSYERQQNFKRQKSTQNSKKISRANQGVTNSPKYKQSLKRGLPPKQVKKQKVQIIKQELKSSNQYKSAENVFDNIHSVLQIPRAHVHSVETRINPQEIQKLQKKIKQINDQLGTAEQLETKQTFKSDQEINNTVHDWKRISYSNEFRFNCKRDSNFEKELERVTILEEKNKAKIGDFVSNQLQLIKLNFIKRAYSKAEKQKVNPNQ